MVFDQAPVIWSSDLPFYNEEECLERVCRLFAEVELGFVDRACGQFGVTWLNRDVMFELAPIIAASRGITERLTVLCPFEELFRNSDCEL